MTEPAPVPEFKEFSPSMRVDVLVSDWRASLPPELPKEAQEQRLYGLTWDAYLEGDYGFGRWCWFECDRLTNALGGSVREVTRVLGPGRYFGFSHRRAVASKVPLDKVYRPRKGDMSTPRPESIVLPHYQLLCVYEVRALDGDPRSKALLEISLGELEEKRRADPFLKFYDTFRTILHKPATPAAAPAPPSPEGAAAGPPQRGKSS